MSRSPVGRSSVAWSAGRATSVASLCAASSACVDARCRRSAARPTASGARGAAISASRATRRSIRSTRANFNKLADRLALQDRQSRQAPRLQSADDAADDQRRALRHRRRASQRRRASTPPPASCCGCTGSRKASAPRRPSRRLSGRGVGYWTDGKGDERIFYVTIGYQLVGLDAKTGHPLDDFGEQRRRRSEDRTPIRSSIRSPARSPGTARRSSPRTSSSSAPRIAPARRRAARTNAKGYVRGYDARTGKRLWIFHTIPRPGEFGNETWLEDSWSYTGNTGVWTQMTVDEELGIAYLPVEIPTGDYFGGHRPGNNLFAESLVAVDLQTGKRIWHFQFVHHPIWDYDVPCAPILADITVNGKPIKAVAQPTKQGLVFVFDRQTGEPVWPIEERPVEKGTVPREWYSPTQPFPTKPPPFERQGFLEADVIDFTPELKAEALKIVSQYKIGPIFTPPITRGDDGKRDCSTSRTAPTGPAARSIPRPASSTSTRTRCCACCRWSTIRSART